MVHAYVTDDSMMPFYCTFVILLFFNEMIVVVVVFYLFFRSGVASDRGSEAGRYPDALPPWAGPGPEGRHVGR